MAKLDPSEFVPDEPSKLDPSEFVPDEPIRAQPVPEPSRLEKVANILRGLNQARADLYAAPARIVGDVLAAKGEDSQNNALTKEFSPERPTGALLNSLGTGYSWGALPKLKGAVAAMQEGSARISPFTGDEQITRPDLSFMDGVKARYKAERDYAYRDEDRAKKAQPYVWYPGMVASTVASPNPFNKLGVGIKAAEGAGKLSRLAAAGGRMSGRLASAAGQGELYAAGSSRKEDWAGKAQDIAEGGTIGGLVGAVAEPISGLGRYFKGLMDTGSKRANAMVGSERAADLASETGRLGGVTTGVKTDLRDAPVYASDLDIEPEIRQGLADWATNEQAKALKNAAARNLLKRLPTRLGQIEQAEGAVSAAEQRATPEAVAAGTQEYLGPVNVLAKEVLPRADRLARSAMPGMSITGQIAQSTGAPVTTLKNLVNAPGVQYWAGKLGGAATRPPGYLASKAVSPLSRYLEGQDPDEDRKKKAADGFVAGTGG